MSGLLALLDDVAAIAKLAAAQLDDVAAQAAKAGSKAAGVVIDDAAVTPKYVVGLPAARELPIVYSIARGSLINKLVILLPICLLLEAFAPWLLTPLLMLGGGYLCFEGAEKLLHALMPTHVEYASADPAAAALGAAHLEKTKVKGAIKTDFILSAEIMAISLAAIETDVIWKEALILAAVGILITVAVYGVVAIIVKADDWGLVMVQKGRLALPRALGQGLVRFVPHLLTGLSIVGTAAMLWVGGNIIVHGLHELGAHLPEAVIKGAAASVSKGVGAAEGFVEWLVVASLDAVVGIVIGGVIVAILHMFHRPEYA
ncbi:MAG: DUF808 domain-containing protein [Sphingomonadales bacterium]